MAFHSSSLVADDGDANDDNDDEYVDETNNVSGSITSPALKNHASQLMDNQSVRSQTPPTRPSSTASAASTSRVISNQFKRKKKVEDKVLETVSEKLSQLQREDQFDIFGRNVAAKLRSLPQEQRIYAEKRINDALFDAELHAFQQNSMTIRQNLASNPITTTRQTIYQQPPAYRPQTQMPGNQSFTVNDDTNDHQQQRPQQQNLFTDEQNPSNRRTGSSNGKREERGNRRRGDRDEEGGSGPKPSGQVSLFAFLEDKLPTQNDEKENDNQAVSGGFNHSTSNQRYNNNSVVQRGRPERLQNRSGGRGSQNNGPTEPRRDDRNRSNPLATQHQKPPRFQNQQRYNDSYQNWSYGSNNDYTYDDRSSFNNSRLSRNYEDFNSEPYNRRTQPPPIYANNEPSHDYGRNNRRYDIHSKLRIFNCVYCNYYY
ncbi:hypothetical protein J6590_032431 [Homalodisca vitripennis]|nr:hypothetical protein J6590_032431 [Homalodisca vitripennis]